MLDHVSLRVADYDRSKRFYAAALAPPGYTLAMDFPVKGGTFELLARLDAIVARHGGRIYLTKDARTSPQVIAAGYPELDAFREVRRRHGLEARFQSIQSRRLEL